MATITNKDIEKYGKAAGFEIPRGGVPKMQESVVDAIKKLIGFDKKFSEIGNVPKSHPVIPLDKTPPKSQIGNVPKQHPAVASKIDAVGPRRPDALDTPQQKVKVAPKPVPKPVPKSVKPKAKEPDKKLETSLAAARKKGDLYYRHEKTGKKMAAVTKEDLDKSGLSLRDYLNQKEGLTRRKSKPPKPLPRPRPDKKAHGGMTKSKSRNGHTDYRKGGLFY